MKSVFAKLLGRAGDLIDVQPVLALFLGGSFLAVFLAVTLRPAPAAKTEARPSLLWLLYHQCARFLWALTLVAFLLASLSLLRVYLHHTLAAFQRSHGRITQANYNAVQTIWGAEQDQGELRAELFYEEEVTERIESEDLTKPAVTRKKIIRHNITANPFVAERHQITLRQNPRKKGSALYGGYETDCRFHWQLRNPADREVNSIIKFPLPAATAMYDNLSAVLNGKDVLPQMQLREGALVLTRDLKAGEPLDLTVSFQSRGMSFWYLQVKEPREVRDFALVMNLPDLPKSRLNYPEGCMTPSSIQPTPDNQGCVLTYRLNHAISNKGMGIALPSLPQPGETTNAVLAEIERGWLLLFATLILGFTLAAANHSVLLAILFGAATACGYGLLADCSDFLLGFWGTAILILVPLFLFLARLLRRFVPGRSWRLLAFQLLLFGIVYPSLAGLDADRQTLYFNLCALIFLALAAVQLAQRLSPKPNLRSSDPAQSPAPEFAAPLIPNVSAAS
jgi:hypothetical protein